MKKNKKINDPLGIAKDHEEYWFSMIEHVMKDLPPSFKNPKVQDGFVMMTQREFLYILYRERFIGASNVRMDIEKVMRDDRARIADKQV